MKSIFTLLLITILSVNTFAETTDYFGNYPSKEARSICGEPVADMFEQRALGWDFNEGKGVEKDYQTAACWFKKAALQGDIPSQRKLGHMYVQGKGVEQDYDKAIFWLKKAALQGDKKATGSVGHLYKNKKQDYQKAIYWYNKAISLNHAGAATQLGHMHRDGWGFKKDVNKAVKWYKKAAEQGNHHGQRNLGLQYLKGQGVKKDYRKAYYWFNKAALQGHEKAKNDLKVMRAKGLFPNDKNLQSRKNIEIVDMFEQRALGWDFNEGKGVEKDYQKAAYWFKKAALQGDSNSQQRLGFMYKHGEGVEQDYDKAIDWLKKSALQGDKESTASVGHLYKNKKQDYQKAIYWYNKAILLKHAGAATQLGHMNKNGKGFKQDFNKAFEWYSIAAEQDNHHGQRYLGYLYLKGKGVKQDDNKAYYWFNKAALQGNEKAVKDILKMRGEGHIPKKRPKEAAALKADDTLSKSSDSKLELTPKSSSGFLKGCQGSTGTGFVVSQSGYVATAQHVVRTKNDCKCDKIMVDGVEATVVREDKESDTALIKVNKNYKNFASLTDRPVKWMDPIYVFGWPNIAGLSFDIDGTEGIVKGLKGETDHHFRISNDIQPGSSGGPIVNRGGRVIGIVSSSLDKVYVQNVNFGNRVARLRTLMKQEKIVASNRVSVMEQSKIPEFYRNVTKAVTCKYSDDLWP